MEFKTFPLQADLIYTRDMLLKNVQIEIAHIKHKNSI